MHIFIILALTDNNKLLGTIIYVKFSLIRGVILSKQNIPSFHQLDLINEFQ